jgi:hypothetical protein
LTDPVDQDLVRSIFDDQDRLDYDPVPDEGPLTKSSFDDDDLVDRHPVP